MMYPDISDDDFLDVPLGESGDVRIVKDARKVTRLIVVGNELMSNEPREADTHLPMLNALAEIGHDASLLMLGLGIGLGAWMAYRRGWTDITIVENSPHVIDLLSPMIQAKMPGILVIEGNAESLCGVSRKYDVIWHDIPLEQVPAAFDRARRIWSPLCTTFLIWDEENRRKQHG
jgi:hypothetical protein